MLANNIHREFLANVDQQMRALLAAQPMIEAAERLEALLRDAGISAHAHGHLTQAGCSAAVISDDHPDQVETALLVANLTFSTKDELKLEAYTMRSMQVLIDGIEVPLAIHHQPAVDIPLSDMTVPS